MLRRPLLVGCLVLAMTLTAQAADGDEAPVRFDGHMLVRVDVRSAADLTLLQSISPDLWTDNPGIGLVDARIPPEQVAALEASGLSYKVLQSDLGPLLRLHEQPAATRSDWDHYWNLAEMDTWLAGLVATYPDLCSISSIGNSVEGRPIKVLRISGPRTGTKPAVFYHAGIHAREWIGPPVVAYLAKYLVTNYRVDPGVTNLVDHTEFYLCLTVNPDGYNYTWTTNRLWRKNRRNNGSCYGVDCNRNWALGWGGGGSSSYPCDETYRGPSAFSEPETQALSNFIIAHPNIRAYMDYHSYSQLLMWPYGYANTLPPEPDRTTFDTLGQEMQALLYGVHGVFYEQGPIYSTIYQASGGSVDWVYGAQDRFGFTIELRDTGTYGFELPPAQILPTCEENLPALLRLSQFASNDLTFSFPGGVPQYLPRGTPTTVQVDVMSQFAAADPNSVRMYYRYHGGAYTEVTMTLVSGSRYQAVLPPTGCTSTPEFYFTATSVSGVNCVSPDCAPGTPYTAMVIGDNGVFYNQPLDSNPGWTVQGTWAFGKPMGVAGDHGGPDPSAGHTGNNVYGYNLNGGYTNSMTEMHLTSTPIDCTGKSGVKLSFWRWLGVEQSNYDHAYVRVSNNGTTWTTIWQNGNTSLQDTTWTYQEFDVSAIADNQATVYLRWTMGTTDSSYTWCGWNIDDVQLFSNVCVDSIGACCLSDGSCAALNEYDCAAGAGAYVGDATACAPGACAPPVCAGDGNCDGVINWRDIDYLVAGQNDNTSAWQALFAPPGPSCGFANVDTNGDGHVNWRDIDPFIALMNSTCP